MKQSNKEIDVVGGSEKGRELYIDRCMEYLLDNLDSIEWVSLAHIRNEFAPITLQDKRKLLKSLIISPIKESG